MALVIKSYSLLWYSYTEKLWCRLNIYFNIVVGWCRFFILTTQGSCLYFSCNFYPSIYNIKNYTFLIYIRIVVAFDKVKFLVCSKYYFIIVINVKNYNIIFLVWAFIVLFSWRVQKVQIINFYLFLVSSTFYLQHYFINEYKS